jgi:integrase
MPSGWTATSSARANIEALGVERGHRTLVITRKGGKVVTIPLAPRTARAIDLAVGERSDGPVFLATDGRRPDRHGAARIVRRTAHRAGITKPVGPHTLRHAFITAALDAGVLEIGHYGRVLHATYCCAMPFGTSVLSPRQ